MWNKKTYFTVNKTVQVESTVLPAGTYVFKLMDSPANRHIVQIFNKDETHLVNTVLAIPNYRLQPTGHSRFLFYETPPGYAPALRAWFYPGDNFGQEFTYPKQLAMVQTVAPTESSRVTKTEENKTESFAERQAPAPSTEQEQTMNQETTTQEQQPTEMAQNTPPPPATTPAPEPQPAPAHETPSQLPRTASPFPLFGLGGGLFLAMYGLLRLKRIA